MQRYLLSGNVTISDWSDYKNMNKWFTSLNSWVYRSSNNMMLLWVSRKIPSLGESIPIVCIGLGKICWKRTFPFLSTWMTASLPGLSIASMRNVSSLAACRKSTFLMALYILTSKVLLRIIRKRIQSFHITLKHERSLEMPFCCNPFHIYCILGSAMCMD